jgi:hypothetical protein
MILSFDMDGTLLAGDRLFPRVAQLLQALKDAGHHLSVASYNAGARVLCARHGIDALLDHIVGENLAQLVPLYRAQGILDDVVHFEDDARVVFKTQSCLPGLTYVSVDASYGLVWANVKPYLPGLWTPHGPILGWPGTHWLQWGRRLSGPERRQVLDDSASLLVAQVPWVARIAIEKAAARAFDLKPKEQEARAAVLAATERAWALCIVTPLAINRACIWVTDHEEDNVADLKTR